MPRTILAFDYQGRKIYPLIEVLNDDHEYCAECMFYPPRSTACTAVGNNMPHGQWCSDQSTDFVWAEGEAAALQYITERLTG